MTAETPSPAPATMPHFDGAVVVDTDCFADTDDATALAIVARCPRLAGVITTDERPDGRRAKGARHLLDLCDRSEVPVIEGAQLGDSKRYWSAHGLIPDAVERQSDSMLEFVDRVCASGRQVSWVGMGPMTNLARVLRHRPELATQLQVTQMGGAVKPRRDGVDRAEHNIRYDVPAAQYVMDRLPDMRLVTLDVTWDDRIAVDLGHELYRVLRQSTVPWAKLLVAHMEQWIDLYYSASRLHDPLTLSAALGWSFVEFEPTRFRMGDDGRMFADPAGRLRTVSIDADYERFMAWVMEALTTPS